MILARIRLLRLFPRWSDQDSNDRLVIGIFVCAQEVKAFFCLLKGYLLCEQGGQVAQCS